MVRALLPARKTHHTPERLRSLQARMRRFHDRKIAEDIIRERRDFARRHVDVQRKILAGCRHPAVLRMPGLLIEVQPLLVIVDQLDGDADGLASVSSRL